MLQECYCSSARRAARILTARYEAALAPHDLSVPQFELLAILHDSDCNGRAIAREIGLNAATVSRNLKPLLRRKLVEATVTKGDARQVQYGLTGSGTATLRNALSDWRAAQKKTAESLPIGTLGMLHTIAQRVAE